MRHALRFAVAASLFSIGTVASPAIAQECVCTTAAQNGPLVGQITSASGQVLASAANGLDPAGVGTPLAAGSQVVTGSGASAQLIVGSCQVDLGPSAEVIILPANGNLCVAASGAQPGINPVVAGVALGGVAGGIAIVAGQDEDSPVSR